MKRLVIVSALLGRRHLNHIITETHSRQRSQSGPLERVVLSRRLWKAVAGVYQSSRSGTC